MTERERGPNLVEEAGTGIDRMLEAMEAALLDPPEFTEKSHSFVVRFRGRSVFAAEDRLGFRGSEASAERAREGGPGLRPAQRSGHERGPAHPAGSGDPREPGHSSGPRGPRPSRAGGTRSRHPAMSSMRSLGRARGERIWISRSGRWPHMPAEPDRLPTARSAGCSESRGPRPSRSSMPQSLRGCSRPSARDALAATLRRRDGGRWRDGRVRLNLGLSTDWAARSCGLCRQVGLEASHGLPRSHRAARVASSHEPPRRIAATAAIKSGPRIAALIAGTAPIHRAICPAAAQSDSAPPRPARRPAGARHGARRTRARH